MAPDLIRCDFCRVEIMVHAIIDSEIWERIAGPNEYAICPKCIDERLVKLGISAECDLEITGKALRSVETDRIKKAGPWRARFHEATGTKGLPALYRGKQ